MPLIVGPRSTDITDNIGIETEGHSCISLTSNEDGSLRSERLSRKFSSYDLSFENGCNVYHTVPTDCSLHMNVTGTGLCVVSICDGEQNRIPLYLLKLGHTCSVDFHLKKHRKQVISTFNKEDLSTGVDQWERTQAKLTIVEGNFNITFSMKGKILLKQRCEISGEEAAVDTSEIEINDTDDDSKCTNATDENYDTDDDENDQKSVSDDENYCYYNISGDEDELTQNNQVDMKYIEEYFDDASSEDKNTEESYTDDDDDTSSECNTASDDEELNVSESTQDERAIFEVPAYDDEATLISEDNMIEMEELSRRSDYRAANRYFLQILRNKRIQRHRIEAVLNKAEDQHLLALLFPKQLMFVSAATQTDDCSLSQVRFPEVQAIFNATRSPLLNIYNHLI